MEVQKRKAGTMNDDDRTKDTEVEVNIEKESTSKPSNSIHSRRFKKKQIQVLKCGECGDVFHEMTELRNHLEYHRTRNESIPESSLPKLINTGPRLFECNICDRVFCESGFLKIHARIHQGLRPYRCPECNLRFDSCIELQKHSNTHSSNGNRNGSDQLRKCDVCDEVFDSAEEYAQHLKTHKGIYHDPSTEPLRSSVHEKFDCKLCGKKIRGLTGLRLHMLNKHEKRYMCPKCLVRFNSKTLLAGHKCLESFTCKECNLVFTSRSAYTGHVRKIHKSKAKTYICSTCKKGFPSQVALDVHLRIHTGEKPFSCEHCGKKFTQMHSRDRHVLTHIGEKNEMCPLCHKAFMTKDQVKTHMLVHNPGDPVNCNYCGKEFRGKLYLKNHLSRCKLRLSETEKKQ